MSMSFVFTGGGKVRKTRTERKKTEGQDFNPATKALNQRAL